MFQVKQLEAQGVNMIVVASHLQGLAYDAELLNDLNRLAAEDPDFDLDDIDLVIAGGGGEVLINQSNALAANAMLEHGIRVFVYPGMSHVKAAVFDGWACLGSANWDKLSFRTNKELNVATSHAPYVHGLLERVFKPDFAQSVELTEPFPVRWSDHLMEMVADYLL